MTRQSELSLGRFDPFATGFLEDPYPAYHRMRAAEPVHRGVPPFPSVRTCYYLFRYDDVAAALADPRLGRRRPAGAAAGAPGAIRRLGRSMVLFNDPPDQLRLRTLLATAFSPDFIERLRPAVEAIVDGLLRDLPADGPFDLVTGLALPLPVLVIADALGLPAEDADRIKRWSDTLIGVTDPRGSDTAVARAAEAADELVGYLRDTVAARRRAPGDDLISRMWLVRRQDDRLAEDEVLANAILLLSAGHETTMGLLGNGVLALLRRPDAWRRLRDEPDLIPLAVEELLRYDSPIQMTFRFALEDLTLGGRRIERGQAVAAVLGAANRDPEAFVEPDRLQVDRPRARHLGFGAGPHFCMGPSLARMEARIALGALLRSMPDLELAGRPRWRETIAFRGLLSLPVASGARP